MSKRWAVVTGASSGIGEAFAHALDARGYAILLVARRRDRLEGLARTLNQAAILAADLQDEAEVARTAEHALALGDVDLLVNNAGFATNGDFLSLDRAREVGMVKLNVLAPLELAHRLLPPMVARKSGGVINVSSIGAFQPVPYMATYGATKAFVLGWSEALAYELRKTGVRVTCVCPGPTATEFFEVAATDRRMAKMPHMMSADAVVERTLAAFDDGRAVVVPGLINWLTAFVTRIFPRALVRTVSGRLTRPRERKALRP